MQQPNILPGRSATGTHSLAVFVVVIGALYFGRDVFVPLALAGLLSFALAPLIAALRRRGLPRTPAVLTVVILAFLSIFVFGFVVAGQVSELGASLPRYEYNIREKVRSLQSSAPGGGFVERAGEVLRDLRKDIEEATEAPAAEEDTSPLEPEAVEPEPIPVQIRQPDPAPLQLLQTIVGPLIEPLATTGIVIVFVVFMLLQREDLRDRFIRLFGTSDLHRTTQALGDAAERVGRYLLMQLVVNVAVGIPIGIGLWLIGVPNPVLWGLLSIVLRFVPFIGPVIAAAFPLALSDRSRSGLDHAPLDGSPLHRPGADQRQHRRTLALRRQHRPLVDRDPRRGDLLDLAVGTGGAASVDSAHRVSGRAGPARSSVWLSRRPVGQRAGARTRRKPVPTPACG